ncbi:MAG: GspH/FimT family pseudopilin [Geopsychrobacter sp.]|nr:GspH/FimT family pseudopilin [Geopsychrobacter sp.]
MNQKGVTLIELIVVIGIMGIVAAMAMPATFAWLADARFRDAAARLESALKQTRDLAITRKLGLQLAVDLDSGNYWIQLPGGTKASSLVNFDSLPPNIQITSGDNCTNTSANGDSDTTTAETGIEFNPNGSGEVGAMGGGVDSTSLCVLDGSGIKRYRVRISLLSVPSATGRVITEDWTGSAWN